VVRRPAASCLFPNPEPTAPWTPSAASSVKALPSLQRAEPPYLHPPVTALAAESPAERVSASTSARTLRHAFITAALDAGVPLRDVREAASHADPRTTMRYDRARTSLDRHATYIVATYVAGAAR
jgi:integrase